jgi:putative DNA primase/helicase
MARSPHQDGATRARAWLQQHGRISERALAETFAKDFDARWRYNTETEYWLEWIDKHWKRRRTPELLEAIGTYASGFAQAFREIEAITHTEAIKLQSQRTVAAIEKICRSLPSFLTRSEQYDADPFLLGTPKGTINLCTGEMLPAVPEDYITVLTPIAPAPKGTKLGTLFRKFLNEITSNDVNFQRTLQQWFGISAQGTSRDQRALFLYGDGGNGKGVLLRTVSHLLGAHAVNAPRNMLMVQRHLHNLPGLVDVLNARMAIATEVDDDATWDTALVKDLTGGDKMSVRRLYENPYELTPRCTPTISGNRKPALKGIDDAVKRRFLVATFKFKVEKVIADFEKELIAKEGPAILRWIIDGSVARCKEGSLYVAPVILEDTDDYFKEENVLEEFKSSYMEPQPAGEAKEWTVRTSEVYAKWKAFCVGSGRSAGAQNSFTTAMRASGVKYHRGENGRFFLNYHLRLIPKEPDDGE